MSYVVFKIRVLGALLSDALSTWHKEVWKVDLDERRCCDGRECCCGGATNRDVWSNCFPYVEQSGVTKSGERG